MFHLGLHACCVLAYVQYFCSVCPATTSSLMRATAGAFSNVVDVYNVATGAWSTAQLSVGRWQLAAASVGNLALFAGGGISGSTLICWEGEMFHLGLRACWVLAYAAVFLFCLPCDHFLSYARHCS
jgi:hypothetical protein